MADPVTAFELYRQELLAALAGDDPVAVLHAERGAESVRLTIELQAGHDRMHLDQFRKGLH